MPLTKTHDKLAHLEFRCYRKSRMYKLKLIRPVVNAFCNRDREIAGNTDQYFGDCRVINSDSRAHDSDQCDLIS